MYFKTDEFYDELLNFRSQLSCCDLSANAQISDKLGLLIIDLVNHTLTNPNFRNYPVDTKEDMRQFALQKCMLGVHRFKLEEYGKEKLFGYFTRCVYLAFLTIITKYYKEKNCKWKYLYQKLLAYGMPHSKIISLIGEDTSKGNGTQKTNKFNNTNLSLKERKNNE